MNVSDLFPSKYLKAADLGTSRPVVVIDHLGTAEFDDGNKPVLFFVGKEKGMVLNKTNAELIAEFLGPVVDNWSGKRIRLYTTKVRDSNGKMVSAIRVEMPPPQQGSQPAPPPPVEADDDESVPF